MFWSISSFVNSCWVDISGIWDAANFLSYLYFTYVLPFWPLLWKDGEICKFKSCLVLFWCRERKDTVSSFPLSPSFLASFLASRLMERGEGAKDINHIKIVQCCYGRWSLCRQLLLPKAGEEKQIQPCSLLFGGKRSCHKYRSQKGECQIVDLDSQQVFWVLVVIHYTKWPSDWQWLWSHITNTFMLTQGGKKFNFISSFIIGYLCMSVYNIFNWTRFSTFSMTLYILEWQMLKSGHVHTSLPTIFVII